ncbi:hypothetical protein WN943_010950 [Citrus x changshan-huyou]
MLLHSASLCLLNSEFNSVRLWFILFGINRFRFRTEPGLLKSESKIN